MSESEADDGAGMSSFSPLQIYITVVVLTIVGFVGIIGNALVIFVYAQKNDKQTATLFILVLAVLDLVTCLTMIPFTILLEATLWRLSVDFLCKAYFVLNSTNTIFGSLLISAIAVDRYLCICHPFSRLMTVPRAKGMVIILVLVSLILGCPPLAAVGVVRKDKENVSQHYCIDSAFVSQNTTTPVQDLIMKIGHQTHSTTYMLCILSVTVLYILIYLSVYRVRQKRQTLKGIRLKSSPAVPPSEGRSARQKVHRWLQSLSKRTREETGEPGGIEEIAEQQPLRPPDYNACVETNENAEVHRTSLSSSKDAPPPYTPGNGAACEQNVSAAVQEVVPAGPEIPQVGQSGRRMSMRFIKDTQVFQNFRTAAMLFIVAIVYILTFLPASLMSYKLMSLNLPVFYLYYLNNAANPIIYSFMNQNFREDVHALLDRWRHSATGQRRVPHRISQRSGARKMMSAVS